MIGEIDNFIKGQCVKAGVDMDIELQTLDSGSNSVKAITNHVHNIVSRYGLTCGIDDNGQNMYINTPGISDHKGNSLKIWSSKRS